VLSFVTAASLGAEYVEFGKWRQTVAELSWIALWANFHTKLPLGAGLDVQLSKDSVPIIYHDWTIHDEKYEVPISIIPCAQFKNLRKTIKRPPRESFEEPAKSSHFFSFETATGQGLSPSEAYNLAIQTPYATLEETFKVTPLSAFYLSLAVIPSLVPYLSLGFLYDTFVLPRRCPAR
jgi:hypothetical protein